MPQHLDRFVKEILHAFPGLYFDRSQDAWIVPGFRPLTVKALRLKIQRWAYRKHSFTWPETELDYLIRKLRGHK